MVFTVHNINPEVGTFSIIAISLRLDFVLSQNVFLESRTVIASNSYRSVHKGPVIASYSYRSDVIDKRNRIYSLSLLGKIAFKSKYIQSFFASSKARITQIAQE